MHTRLICAISRNPDPRTHHYLDFATAAEVVAGARARARERGDLALAPPYPLTLGHRGIIESALAAPGASWGGHERYPDLPAKAAALLYALSKSQACPDGNKRVALLLTVAFIEMNGGALLAEGGELAGTIIDAASSDASRREEVVETLTGWFRARLAYADEPEEAQ